MARISLWVKVVVVIGSLIATAAVGFAIGIVYHQRQDEAYEKAVHQQNIWLDEHKKETQNKETKGVEP